MIPKIIHHIWPGEDTFRYTNWRVSWMKHNPDWTFYFWRLNNLPFDKLLNSTKDIVSTDKFPYIIKSGVLRWDILRIFGGLFVCTDMECFRSFDKLTNTSSFCGKATKNITCDAIFGAEPENEIVKKASNALSFNVLNIKTDTLDYDTIMSTVGPVASREFLNMMQIIYDPEYLYIKNEQSYSIHHWTNSTLGGWTNTLTTNKRGAP